MLAILFAMAALSGWYMWREWRIDSCSSSTGEWNYSTSVCDPLPN
jgi:hypothetical protein